ncbi:MAG: alkaline phosphatase family protein [Bacteroidia bacterium]
MVKKLLFIGWDAADWKIIRPLLNSGQMPHLAKLIKGGATADIQTLHPPVSPMLWTSIATGKRAWQHGICNFFEQVPGEQSFIPVLGASRKVKALWNILSVNGYCTNVVNWWPSHPAEEINGCMVSDYFFQRNVDAVRQSFSKTGGVYPALHEPGIINLIKDPDELPLQWMEMFFPLFTSASPAQMQRMSKAPKVVATMLSVFEVSNWLMQMNDWNFHAVYFDAIDKFCHMFMRYQPPQQSFVTESDFQMFRHAVTNIYRVQDNLLGEMIRHAGHDTTVLLMSDHGFRSGKDRLAKLPEMLFRPLSDHRDTGIFLLSGPGIKAGTQLTDVSLLDVCPTVLYAMDLPVANDMVGRVLTEAFTDRKVVKRTETYESARSERKYSMFNPAQSGAMLKQLEDLGYISLRGNFNEQQQRMLQESTYVTAMSLMEENRFTESFEYFTALVSEDEKEPRFLSGLFFSALALKRFDIATETVELIQQMSAAEVAVINMRLRLLMAQQKFLKALELIGRYRQQYAHHEEFLRLVSRCYIQSGRYDEAFSAAIQAASLNEEEPDTYFLMAGISFRQRNWEAALGYGLEAIQYGCRYPQLHLMMGKAAFQSQQYELAASAYERALSFYPRHQMARTTLVSIYTQHLHQPDRAAPHQTYLEAQLLPQIIVVSGLPRSGTSMMMQALAAGGIPVLTDGIRSADEHNPKGYMEYEKVKFMPSNHNWLQEASGKAVKIIANLLPFLPANYQYKIILMERDLSAVMLSQDKMLRTDATDGKGRAYRLILGEHQKKIMDKALSLGGKQNIEVLSLRYDEVLEAPFSQMLLVQDFLERDLDVHKMAGTVDPSLNHNRS